MEDETDEGELRRIKKGLTKAEEEKLELQQQCNDTGIQESVAKKRKAKDLWAKANPRAIKFRKEIKNRGLKKTPTMPQEEQEEEQEEEEQDNAGSSYADVAKKTTEKGLLARIFRF